MLDPNSPQRRFAEFSDGFLADFRQDVTVYLELAAKYPGPVLEVGCRTGRVTWHLAQAGHEVCAVDTMRPMLEVARRNLEPFGDRVRLMDFDLRSSVLYDSFCVVFATQHVFNTMIEIEEQRRFLRHVVRSMSSPGVIALDLFCPLSFVRPDEVGRWRTIERTVDGRPHVLRDRREMLTPLLERRTQVFHIAGSPENEHVSHRRYIPPQHAAALLEEAGFEGVRWIERYDASTSREVGEDSRPTGPFLVVGER